MAKQKTKSPLKFEPLHNPGQSLDEQIMDLLMDKIVPWVMWPIFMLVITVDQWIWYLKPPDLPPYLAMLITLILVVIAAVRLPRYYKELQQLRQGRQGEQAVGQYLDDLKKYGYNVIHDIVGDGLNVDHIVISEHGIFVIETKTWSKPAKGEAKITFNGNDLLANGFVPDRNPLRQAELTAMWVSDVLKESSGFDFPTKPVVVFPGWFVDPSCNQNPRGVWVLNPKALETFIQNQKKCINPDMVKMAAKHLKAYVRMSNKRV